MEAIIYTRVSHQGRSISIRDQEKECRAFCERKDIPVRAIFSDDGISASRYGKHRPGWAAVKAELRQGDILVVWEASRAHRDLAEFVALRDLCASLNVPLSYSGRILDFSEGDDRFSGGIDALVAERESEDIKKRVRRGVDSAARAGSPHSRPPWGYKSAPREVDEFGTFRAAWEIDPVEGPRVKEAAERLLGGQSLRAVLRWLGETGYAPSSLSNLRRVVTNPAIAGQRVHQGNVLREATWPALITERQREQLEVNFDHALLTRGYTCHPGPEPKYLLSYVAMCAKCDGPLGPVLRKHRGPNKESYTCLNGCCQRLMRRFDAEVEAELFDVLSKIKPPDEQPAPEVDDTELQDAKKLLNEWIRAAEKGEVGPQAFARVERSLTARIAGLNRPASPSRKRRTSPEEIRKNWQRYTMRRRREVIRAFLTVKLLPGGVVDIKAI